MSETSKYPPYPTLTEEGEEQAQLLINKFKVEAKEIIERLLNETIGEIYCEVVPHIASDSWTNYRNQLMNGLRNYDNRKTQGSYDFKDIRKKIYEEYREDIINDLNQDMLKEIDSLKKQLEYSEKYRH